MVQIYSIQALQFQVDEYETFQLGGNHGSVKDFQRGVNNHQVLQLGSLVKVKLSQRGNIVNCYISENTDVLQVNGSQMSTIYEGKCSQRSKNGEISMFKRGVRYDNLLK